MGRHIRRDDTVMVMTGGRGNHPVGKVLSIICGENPDQDRVIVEGVNIRKKHVKPDQKNPQGGFVTKEMSVHISNVMPVVDGKPSRVRFESRPDGSKVRIAVAGGKPLGPELKKPKQA